MISHAMREKQRAKELLYWSPEWEILMAERTIKRRPLVRFHAAKRRAAKIQRTPAWADQTAIKAIYELAHQMSRETGEDYVVDHVIPLQGELVSGLHVAGNLSIITASENSKKRNAYKI